MRPGEFEKMRSLEDNHWWFRGRRYLLRNTIRRLGLKNALILDAGCGTGFAARELNAAGTVTGLDVSEDALKLASKYNGVKGCVSRVESMPFEDGTFDLVVALDILEHLDDDLPALTEIYRVCKPNGHILVTVPACQRLWSHHDEALGHRRRYSLDELEHRVADAGFTIRNLSYYVTGVFPLAALYRSIRRKDTGREAATDLFPVPEPANFLLSALMKIESVAIWNIRLSFGLSAFVLAQKKEPVDR